MKTFPTTSKIFLLLLLLLASCVPAIADYELFVQRYSADPAPLALGDRMWIYTTHDNLEPGYSMRDYNALSSDDLVNWRDEGIMFSFDSIDWADYAWAQQVIQLPNKTFALYYAAWCSGHNPKCKVPGVGVAYSETPAGPFKDVLGGPIMPGNDPGVFVDPDDPSIRVLCSNVRPDQSPGNYGPLCGLLNEDMVSFKETGQSTVPSSWPRVMPSFNRTTWRWFEAPWLSKIHGRYYLSYMMEGCDIGYAVSDTPMGNYTPARGPLMWGPPYDNQGPHTARASNNTQGWGNNHQGMVEFPAGSGLYYLAYHNQKLRQDRNISVAGRNIALDRLYINETDGALLPVTSTPQWLRPLKYLDPYLQTAAFQMASCSPGVDTEPCRDAASRTPGAQALNLHGLVDQSYVHVRAVDFGTWTPPQPSLLPPSAGSSRHTRSQQQEVQQQQVQQQQVQQVQQVQQQVQQVQAPSTVTFRVASAVEASIAIEIGGAWRQPPTRNGEEQREWVGVATCRIGATGGERQWKSVACNLSAAAARQLTGVVSDMRFVFSCAIAGSKSTSTTSSCAKFAWWRFDAPSLLSSLSIRRPSAPPNRTVVPVTLASRGASGNFVACRQGRRRHEKVLHVQGEGGEGERGQGQGGGQGGEPAAAAAAAAALGTFRADATSGRDPAAQLRLVDNEDGSWTLLCAAANGGGTTTTTTAPATTTVDLAACAAADGSRVDAVPADVAAAGAAPCTKWRLQGTTDSSFALQSWSGRKGWLVGTTSGGLAVTAESYLHPTAKRFVVDDAAHFDLTERHLPS